MPAQLPGGLPQASLAMLITVLLDFYQKSQKKHHFYQTEKSKKHHSQKIKKETKISLYGQESNLRNSIKCRGLYPVELPYGICNPIFIIGCIKPAAGRLKSEDFRCTDTWIRSLL